MAEAFVMGLAAAPADVDLLHDDGELEGGEDLVPADVADIEAGALGIAGDGLGARRKAPMPGRHRRDAAPGRIGARLGPVIEDIAEIGERIAQERVDSAAEGYPEFEVRIPCASRREAAAPAHQLEQEGIPLVPRPTAVPVRATDEDRALNYLAVRYPAIYATAADSR